MNAQEFLAHSDMGDAAMDEELHRLRERVDNLERAIHAAHGLLAPLGNQVTPSVMAIREALQILARNS